MAWGTKELGLFQSRNRVSSNFNCGMNINPSRKELGFQSRNRVSSNFNPAGLVSINSCIICFNLVIEYLLIST